MIKISVTRQPHRLTTDVYIFQESDDHRQITMFNFKEDGKMVATTKQYNQGDVVDVKPSLTLMEEDFRELIRAFVEYGREQGFKNADESFAKGKLNATEDHLKDLRKLLKL